MWCLEWKNAIRKAKVGERNSEPQVEEEGVKKLDVRLQLKFEVDVHLQFSLRRMRRRRRRRRGMKKLDVHL